MSSAGKGRHRAGRTPTDPDLVAPADGTTDSTTAAGLPLLGRLGRHTARHPWRYLVTWLVVVLASFGGSLGLLGNESLFDRLVSGDIVAPGEAEEGRDLLRAASPEGDRLTVMVGGADLADPAVAMAVTEVAADLQSLPGVTAVSAPMLTPGWPTDPRSLALVAGQDTASGGFLVSVVLDHEVTAPQQDAVLAALEEAADTTLAPVSQTRSVGGVPLLIEDITGQIEQDLKVGEGIALPVSLLIMVFVFGGLLAAGMPIIGAIASIAGGLASLLAFSHVLDLDASVVNIVTVMGLGLCIDYGLLLVSRFREEVALVAPGVPHRELTDEQVQAAVTGAVATAGRTILFSALIVGISLSGLVVFDAPIMRAIGAAGVSVVVVALLVALTLVPALCTIAARRLGPRRGAEVSPDDGWFSRLAAAVQRRPALAAICSVAVLLLLAAPALGLRLTSSGTELLPTDAPQRVFFTELNRDYPALSQPAVTLVADAPLAQVQQWAAMTAGTLPSVSSVDPPQQVGDLVSVALRVNGPPMGDAARALVEEVKEQRPDYPTWVTGQAASLADFTSSVSERAPWAALWIGSATFVLLFLLTGSVVIPVKALVLNVISLGASLGLLVWVFQQGHLEGLLRYQSVGAIESVIPLLVLAFGFGLSMDYEVFLLSRIIDLHEQGADDDTAVRLGLQRSGRIITSAALIIVVVFAGFAVGQMLVIKETGFALATAVAIDATIVRMVVVPATMTLLGRWNWWAPTWLRGVHARWGVTEHGSPVHPPAPIAGERLPAQASGG